MEWVRAFHIVAIIAWMAGLLYLPRLFVYHAAAERGSAQSETFKVMERRLYFGITTPAALASWLLGLWLAFGYGLVDWSEGWMWLKAALVFGLSFYHLLLGAHQRAFRDDRNERPPRYFRLINEIPTLVMIVIVVAVVVKPF
jgi:protoporphyrinogen IX oxidase